MSRPLRLALAHVRCEKGALETNLVLHRSVIAGAREQGVDILVLPEMSLTGYVNPERRPDIHLDLDGPEVAEALDLTSGSDMTVLFGIIERNPGEKPFITQIVARNGEMLGYYRKVTIEGDEAPLFSVGGPPAVFLHGPLRFGVAVCADIGNEVLFAAYAGLSATAVLHPSAPGLYGEQATRNWQSGYDWWRGECETRLGTYARQYGLTIAGVSQAGRTVDEDFPGGAYVFTPEGRLAASTTDWSEGVLYASIRVRDAKTPAK